ncbi:PfkB family carbohydrate kinase [Varunaivibrio sulfuroxidans]|uniref:RfaE bifunctional protein nucleotidyltransferase chain/domain n=1 Tax=Varunaivibrio sulfuroxidans TaxID=1773489 RepID=A0A4R3JFR5_9PROT|nr:PfkB family carbohydrate kinase [Varunaivibrio sulfuroxidans]TCS64724.1 rfaE bifunctional protein nucleotidyltransferase chain/domain [Varunaivibrio sulfuroxidans]WES29970.1 PfkB family carbohydrate kinase [Varunaivibrio sulfuroxidans]
MINNKIVSLEELSDRTESFRGDGKTVVQCHGTFDLMHTGHIRYLQRAKLEGDVLVVTVTADKFVNKGPGRPVFSEQLRAENLAALECVDLVAVNHDVSAVNAIHKIKPNVYVKGSEYRSHGEDITGNIRLEQEATTAHGGRVFYTDEITFSSTSLLNEHFGVFSPETKDFLMSFQKKWPQKDVSKLLDSLSDLNVLVIGDAIIDQYHYVSSLGQTGKGNVLAVKYDTEEQFAGGSIAIANHVAQFSNSVTLVAGLGDHDSHEDYIRTKLNDNVTPVFSYFVNAPTVTKRRFVDSDMSKLFEVYFFHDQPQLKNNGADTCTWLEKRVADYDVVIVTDFGNGFITREMTKIISDRAPFLAVNTQVNSGNRGYHVINRYSRADFISLNEPELRLAAHDRHRPLETIGEMIAARLDSKYLAVTRGMNGVMMYEAEPQTFHKIPALSSRVVDRIGAGDAFLALSALALSKGLGADLSAFLGAVAAAIDVQIVCNREPIDPIAMKKYITTLLK